MQRLGVSGAVRPIYGSLGVKWLKLEIRGPKCTVTYDILEHKWSLLKCLIFDDN